MKQTWRWFGPSDKVSIDDMLQAGVEGVVSALHQVPTGDVWTREAIRQRIHEIATTESGEASGLTWDVVESLPVSEAIKKQQGPWQEHIANYQQSLRNLAAEGIEIVCYNFMPVLDWTRTHLHWRLPTGATCMRFDYIDFAVFDIHILKRAEAVDEFPAEVVAEAASRFAKLDEDAQQALAKNVIFGLPGAVESYGLDEVRELLAEYHAISPERLRQHFTAFLEDVVPVAEEEGLRLCCHPDDPPFPLLGLPRIMSTESDYRYMLDAVPSNANGMALCAGSLGARPDNDLAGMMERLGDRVHFLHLRNVHRESDDIAGSFHETEHLGGDNDMVGIIAAALREEKRRKAEGRKDCSIPMRPDHGLDILDDLKRPGQPGYPALGRVKGLAEMRGVMMALSHNQEGV